MDLPDLIVLYLSWFSIDIQKDKSKIDGKDEESIQSSTTPDPGYPVKPSLSINPLLHDNAFKSL